MVAIGNTLIPLLGKLGKLGGGAITTATGGKGNREVVNGNRKEVGDYHCNRHSGRVGRVAGEERGGEKCV